MVAMHVNVAHSSTVYGQRLRRDPDRTQARLRRRARRQCPPVRQYDPSAAKLSSVSPPIAESSVCGTHSKDGRDGMGLSDVRSMVRPRAMSLRSNLSIVIQRGPVIVFRRVPVQRRRATS